MITGLAAVHALAQTVNVAGINPRLANIVKRLDKNADSEYPDEPTTGNQHNGEPS